ncbi:arsenite efflux transporter [Venturia nashicola]|nr:arsenite efflux transporter [Venturia nashicola]
MNFVTAPLIADLFLLAISAIGRAEVKAGTIGADNISPIDIMVFFLSLAYIAISIDASGLVRYLAFKVLLWGGDNGHRLFFYLYTFFFTLTACIGNDPVILSGTAFLAYMTRVSKNIMHPRAWIHSQFAIANIGSAILVSSNPTNLVLAGAFEIPFINYSANMILPVVFTAVILFPFLLYVVFNNKDLVPAQITMEQLSADARKEAPVNPNIPHARGAAEEEERSDIDDGDGQESKKLSLQEIMHPFLDKKGAAAGGIIMAVTLVTVLVLNAASEKIGKHPVFYVTLPASVLCFGWDVAYGWKHREATRLIARKGLQAVEEARERRQAREKEARQAALDCDGQMNGEKSPVTSPTTPDSLHKRMSGDLIVQDGRSPYQATHPAREHLKNDAKSAGDMYEKRQISQELTEVPPKPRRTLSTVLAERYRWSQVTFPSATAVASHLPYALVPFAFSMFVLVEGLVKNGWVPVFAHGWDHWVTKTGTIGAIGGMAFLSVILCNFAGTNIGTTILLCRMLQAWQKIRLANNMPISDRTFWGTVYSMAIGVNYGAFSAAFSASLAGLLWRDILARKHIHVHSSEFARVNLPIIAISMVVGCVVLVIQVYIIRKDTPYNVK